MQAYSRLDSDAIEEKPMTSRRIIGVALALLWLPLLVTAQEKLTAPSVGQNVRGTVVRVAGPDNYFILRTTNGQEMRLGLGEQAVLRLGDRPVQLADLREGTEVVVVYTTMGDRYLVRSL